MPSSRSTTARFFFSFFFFVPRGVLAWADLVFPQWRALTLRNALCSPGLVQVPGRVLRQICSVCFTRPGLCPCFLFVTPPWERAQKHKRHTRTGKRPWTVPVRRAILTMQEQAVSLHTAQHSSVYGRRSWLASLPRLPLFLKARDCSVQRRRRRVQTMPKRDNDVLRQEGNRKLRHKRNTPPQSEKESEVNKRTVAATIASFSVTIPPRSLLLFWEFFSVFFSPSFSCLSLLPRVLFPLAFHFPFCLPPVQMCSVLNSPSSRYADTKSRCSRPALFGHRFPARRLPVAVGITQWHGYGIQIQTSVLPTPGARRRASQGDEAALGYALGMTGAIYWVSLSYYPL